VYARQARGLERRTAKGRLRGAGPCARGVFGEVVLVNNLTCFVSGMAHCRYKTKIFFCGTTSSSADGPAGACAVHDCVMHGATLEERAGLGKGLVSGGTRSFLDIGSFMEVRGWVRHRISVQHSVLLVLYFTSQGIAPRWMIVGVVGCATN
jgi:hypothetical protein